RRRRGRACREWCELGQQLDQLGCGVELPPRLVGWQRAEVRPKEVEEGRPGDGAVALEALAREAGQPPLGSARLDLGHQARLADPGFAAEQDRLALALV